MASNWKKPHTDFSNNDVDEWSADAYQKAHRLLNAITAFTDPLSLATVAQPLLEKIQRRPPTMNKATWKKHVSFIRSIPQLSPHLINAMDVLLDALRLFGPDRVYVSFNGGKEASVVLYLYVASLVRYQQMLQDDSPAHAVAAHFLKRPNCLYFRDEKAEFPEILEFVHQVAIEWDLNIRELGSDINEGILECLKDHDRLPIAFILGTRFTDPNVNDISWFSPSTRNMSATFLRINPIIHWNYGMTWNFLYYFQQRYCKLYDCGYTSIGTRYNTTPNSFLWDENSDSYLPAYYLKPWHKERDGRGSSRPASTAQNFLSELSDGEPLLEEQEPFLFKRHRNALDGARTAGIIVIGTNFSTIESYAGNIQGAIERLRQQSIQLCHVAFMSSSATNIAEEVQLQSSRYGIVITIGGIFPECNNNQNGALAKTFGKALVLNSPILTAVRKSLISISRKNVPSIMKKIHLLPELMQLRFPSAKADAPSSWPILQCWNVFFLPAHSAHFFQNLDNLCMHCLQRREVYCRQVRLLYPEETFNAISDELIETVSDIAIGSYTVVDESGQKETILSLESSEKEIVNKGIQNLAGAYNFSYSCFFECTITANHFVPQLVSTCVNVA